MIRNAMSIDVEDYYMVSAFADVVRFRDWKSYDSRLEKNTYRILELLAEYGVKATFFILGWIGENYPTLVRDICSAGHEVASHGYIIVSSMNYPPMNSVRISEGRKKFSRIYQGAGLPATVPPAIPSSVKPSGRWIF